MSLVVTAGEILNNRHLTWPHYASSLILTTENPLNIRSNVNCSCIHAVSQLLWSFISTNQINFNLTGLSYAKLLISEDLSLHVVFLYCSIKAQAKEKPRIVSHSSTTSFQSAWRGILLNTFFLHSAAPLHPCNVVTSPHGQLNPITSSCTCYHS